MFTRTARPRAASWNMTWPSVGMSAGGPSAPGGAARRSGLCRGGPKPKPRRPLEEGSPIRFGATGWPGPQLLGGRLMSHQNKMKRGLTLPLCCFKGFNVRNDLNGRPPSLPSVGIRSQEDDSNQHQSPVLSSNTLHGTYLAVNDARTALQNDPLPQPYRESRQRIEVFLSNAKEF